MPIESSHFYETIASEYYDATLHPTCANFRDASLFLINNFIKNLSIPDGWICEVGSGKSSILSLFSLSQAQNHRIMITDASPSMLKYSKELPNAHYCEIKQATAYDLPLPNESVSVLVSSLGDSYNVWHFWKEVRRILSPEGWVIFTTPSFDWANLFRPKELKMAAEFKNSKHLNIPSWIYPEEKQVRIMKMHQLLIESISHFYLSQLKSKQISSKLHCIEGNGYPLVSAYIAKRLK